MLFDRVVCVVICQSPNLIYLTNTLEVLSNLRHFFAWVKSVHIAVLTLFFEVRCLFNVDVTSIRLAVHLL